MILVNWLIRRFDHFLRRRLGIFEYWDHPRALFRVRLTTAGYPVELPDAAVPEGAPVMEMHYWNERLPAIPAQGADLGWALEFQRRTIASFRELARLWPTEPGWQDVQAVTAVIVLFSAEVGAAGEGFLRRLGFEVFPHRTAGGRFGEFWENLYTWLLIGTYNPGSAARHQPLDLTRRDLWMSADRFLERYGGKPAKESGG